MITSLDMIQNSSLIWLMGTGLLLGALHALEPGHAKGMIAAFVVATRGSVPQAVLLGLSAAISHSVLIWVLAAAALYFGNSFIGDEAEPWLQLGSGIAIVGIGITMLWRLSNAGSHESDHHRDDHHPHHDHSHGGHSHSHADPAADDRENLAMLSNAASRGSDHHHDDHHPHHDHPHGGHSHSHDGPATDDRENLPMLSNAASRGSDHHHDHPHHHSHGGHGHSHDGRAADHHGNDPHAMAHARQVQRRFAGQNVTTRQIMLFGLSSGLMPCPAALTLLLVCLRLKKIMLGVGLVTAFSLGLAVTLVTLGVGAALGMRHAARLPGFSRALGVAPYVSSALVIGVGVFMGVSGFLHLPGSA